MFEVLWFTSGFLGCVFFYIQMYLENGTLDFNLLKLLILLVSPFGGFFSLLIGTIFLIVELSMQIGKKKFPRLDRTVDKIIKFFNFSFHKF